MEKKKISFSLSSTSTSTTSFNNNNNNNNINNINKKRKVQSIIGHVEKEDSQQPKKIFVSSLSESSSIQEEKKLIIPSKSLKTSTLTSTSTANNPIVKNATRIEKKELGFGLVRMGSLSSHQHQKQPQHQPILLKPKDYGDDINDRPLELSIESEAYQNIPVEEFGAALLRGMGWKDGQGVGKYKHVIVGGGNDGSGDKNGDAPPTLRPKNLGLGAKPPPTLSFNSTSTTANTGIKKE